jgi:hypothetical protein
VRHAPFFGLIVGLTFLRLNVRGKDCDHPPVQHLIQLVVSDYPSLLISCSCRSHGENRLKKVDAIERSKKSSPSEDANIRSTGGSRYLG